MISPILMASMLLVHPSNPKECSAGLSAGNFSLTLLLAVFYQCGINTLMEEEFIQDQKSSKILMIFLVLTSLLNGNQLTSLMKSLHELRAVKYYMMVTRAIQMKKMIFPT